MNIIRMFTDSYHDEGKLLTQQSGDRNICPRFRNIDETCLSYETNLDAGISLYS